MRVPGVGGRFAEVWAGCRKGRTGCWGFSPGVGHPVGPGPVQRDPLARPVAHQNPRRSVLGFDPVAHDPVFATVGIDPDVGDILALVQPALRGGFGRGRF